MQNPRATRWIMWSLAILFYFYQYFLRVSPAVLTNDLIDRFNVHAAAIGNMSANYFYVYALLQIPTGVLMDRFGAKKLLSFGSVVCGIGTLLFGVAHTFGLIDLGRLLQGVGSSFAFIGMIYICSHWFEASKLALLIGLGDSLGKLGAVAGAGPLSDLIKVFHFQHVMLWIGIGGIFLGLIILLLIKEDKKKISHKLDPIKKLHLGHHLKSLCMQRQHWINLFVTSVFSITMACFGGLWGVPFIQLAYHVSEEVASYAMSTFFLGCIIGGPIIGHLSDAFRKRAYFLTFCGITAALFLSILIYTPYFSIYWVFILLFAIGLLYSAQNLGYCISLEQNPAILQGTAVGMINFTVFLLGAISQPFVGLLLDLNHSHVGAQAIYPVSSYQYALLLCPLSFLLSGLGSLFLKEA